jgi:hypothetical protein
MKVRLILGAFAASLLASLPVYADTVYTAVTIPATDDIQTNLISTFPTGNFTANNTLATPFQIPATSTSSCGIGGVCNFYDGFGFSGDGSSITMNVSIPNVTNIYTLMNAYDPAGGQTLATIEFVGSLGATETFDLVGGSDIRDFYQGIFTNTLTNTVPGVDAETAFSCNQPDNCYGAGGSGNVSDGANGNYVIDEQDFSLDPVFATQTLTQIVLTDTYNGSDPILLGVTAGAASPSTPVPEPPSILLLGAGLCLAYLGRRRLGVSPISHI